jgi:hypothetical protein
MAEAVLQFVKVLDQQIPTPGLVAQDGQNISVCGGLDFPAFGCRPEPESGTGTATVFPATRHEPRSEVGRRLSS